MGLGQGLTLVASALARRRVPTSLRGLKPDVRQLYRKPRAALEARDLWTGQGGAWLYRQAG